MPRVVSVVLPAAGCGERMNLTTPKQYCCILGKPVISYTIAAFEALSWISDIIVIVTEDYMSYMKKIIRDFNHTKVILTVGGSSRHRSIYSGIFKAVEVRPDVELLVIHDAVRPFVSKEAVENICDAAAFYGAAGLVRPLVSTIVKPEDDHLLKDTLDRSKYRASEMPQAFSADVIKRAYEKCTQTELDCGTECLELARKYGETNVKLIETCEDLWKITYERDLSTAELLVKKHPVTLALFCIDLENVEAICQVLNNFIQMLTVSSFIKHLSVNRITLPNGIDKEDSVFTSDCILYVHKQYSNDLILDANRSFLTESLQKISPRVIVHIFFSKASSPCTEIHFNDMAESLFECAKSFCSIKKNIVGVVYFYKTSPIEKLISLMQRLFCQFHELDNGQLLSV